MRTICRSSLGETIQPIRPARSNLLNKQHTRSSNKPGKVTLVAGDGRGIGAATATLLATRGASVVVNYLKNSATASKVIAQIHANGGQALAVQANIQDQQQAEALVQAALIAIGGMNRVYEELQFIFVYHYFSTVSSSIYILLPGYTKSEVGLFGASSPQHVAL